MKNSNFNFYISNNRILLFIFFIIISFFILIFRIIYMQIFNFNYYCNKSYNNCIKKIKLYPVRGLIFDRNGVILAKNNILYKFKILRNKNFNNLDKFKKFVKLTNDDLEKINIFVKNNDKYLILKKIFFKKDILDFISNIFLFPYIKIKKTYIRNYPFKELTSHITGYVSKIDKKDLNYLKKNNLIENYLITDYIGKTGIEKKYESLLKGKIGFKEIEINNKGKIIKLKNIKLPNHGNDIYLTVNIKLHKYITNLVKNSKSSIIVANPNNGEILSLISTPSYDSNKFSNGISRNEYNEIINNESYPMLNRSIQGIYSPASTVKPYISLFALYDKLIHSNNYVFDSSLWLIQNIYKIYRDLSRLKRGWINLVKAIEVSSDTYFYNVACQYGINNLYKRMLCFEFNKKTKIDLVYEKSGNIPNEIWKKNKFNKVWYPGDTISVGIGQGYWNVTPIQMLKSLIFLINCGICKIPHLLMCNYDFNINKMYFFKNKIIKINKNINSKYWKLIKHGMYNVAHGKNGTIKNNFKNCKYKIGAKSGTSQLYSANNNNINYKNIPKKLRDHKLMIAYAPFDDPKFAIFIILENGGSEKYNIGYLTRKIFDYLIFKYE